MFWNDPSKTFWIPRWKNKGQKTINSVSFTLQHLQWQSLIHHQNQYLLAGFHLVHVPLLLKIMRPDVMMPLPCVCSFTTFVSHFVESHTAELTEIEQRWPWHSEAISVWKELYLPHVLLTVSFTYTFTVTSCCFQNVAVGLKMKNIVFLFHPNSLISLFACMQPPCTILDTPRGRQSIIIIFF